MSKFRWPIFGLDEMAFKRSGDGWLFTAPGFWFWRRTYRMTDEQKAKLVGPLRRMWWFQLVAIMVAVFIGFQLQDYYLPSANWLGVPIAILALMIAFWVYVAVAIRPLLSDLTPSEERITFSDRFEWQAKTYPVALIIAMFLTCLMFVAAGIAVAILGEWSLTDILAMAFFGILAVYWAALLRMKRRQVRQ